MYHKDPKNPWIALAERKPEVGVDVEIWDSAESGGSRTPIFVAKWDGKKWQSESGWADQYRARYWRPHVRPGQ